MKRGQIIGIFVLIVLISMSFVAAQAADIIKGTQDAVRPFLEALFGSSDFVFEQLLFGFIIIAFIYMALSQVEVINDKPWLMWIITLSAAVLGMRFIASEKLVKALMFPQGILGITLLVAFPFIMVFWFIEFGLEGPRTRILRKLCWGIFAVVFVYFWFRQFYVPAHTDITWAATIVGPIPTSVVNVPASIAPFGYLYLLVALVSVVLLISDEWVQGTVRRSMTQTRRDLNRGKAYANLEEQRIRYGEQLAKGAISAKDYKNFMKELADVEKTLK